MQTIPMWKTSLSMVLINALIVVLLASCAYKYEVIRPLDNRFQHILEPGDTVRIVTTDGRNLKLRIKSISSEAMIGQSFWGTSGKGQQVDFSDIARLEKRAPEEDTGGGFWRNFLDFWLTLFIIIFPF